MCELMEEYSRDRVESAKAKGREEGREEGLQVGREESAKEIAIEIWNQGIHDIEAISKMTKLSPDKVKKLIEGKSA